jgi:hypothetical protein
MTIVTTFWYYASMSASIFPTFKMSKKEQKIDMFNLTVKLKIN